MEHVSSRSRYGGLPLRTSSDGDEGTRTAGIKGGAPDAPAFPNGTPVFPNGADVVPNGAAAVRTASSDGSRRSRAARTASSKERLGGAGGGPGGASCGRRTASGEEARRPRARPPRAVLDRGSHVPPSQDGGRDAPSQTGRSCDLAGSFDEPCSDPVTNSRTHGTDAARRRHATAIVSPSEQDHSRVQTTSRNAHARHPLRNTAAAPAALPFDAAVRARPDPPLRPHSPSMLPFTRGPTRRTRRAPPSMPAVHARPDPAHPPHAPIDARRSRAARPGAPAARPHRCPPFAHRPSPHEPPGAPRAPSSPGAPGAPGCILLRNDGRTLAAYPAPAVAVTARARVGSPGWPGPLCDLAGRHRREES